MLRTGLQVHHKYHIIYRTTCTITGRYYVGMHSTNHLVDRCLGSGKILHASIRKHGRQNHTLEVLCHAPDRETLALLEAKIVNDSMLSDPKCMNIVKGGNTTRHEYDRNPSSAKLQAQSLRSHFEHKENRERQRQANTLACQRSDVVNNIAKKLTVEDVKEMRLLHEQGYVDYNDIGKRFNVSGNTA